MPHIEIATRSEQGRRDANEDMLCSGRAGFGWYAVLSDGAGGHARGADASRTVVTCLDAMFQSLPADGFAPESLTRAVLATHALMQREQEDAVGLQRMHATVVALCVDAQVEHALWSNVGDSRLYRVRRGRTELLTTDDSVVQQLVAGGLLTPAQARRHPMSNQLVAALGTEGPVAPHTPETPLPLQDGDAFLLCSDGWWQWADDEMISSTLAFADSPGQWLDAMRRHVEAQRDPHQDNFSAIALWAGLPRAALGEVDDEATLPRVRASD